MGTDKQETKEIALMSSREIGEKASQTTRAKVLQAFENAGVTHELMAGVARDLLTATKQKAQWVKGEDGEPGGWAYSKRMEDNTTRYNTLQLLLNFHDAMPSKKIDINDTRQTRSVVSQLFAKMEENGLLGAEEKSRKTEATWVEGEIVDEVMKGKKVSYASLNPMDMEEDE
jgi:hypothetical protein